MWVELIVTVNFVVFTYRLWIIRKCVKKDELIKVHAKNIMTVFQRPIPFQQRKVLKINLTIMKTMRNKTLEKADNEVNQEIVFSIILITE